MTYGVFSDLISRSKQRVHIRIMLSISSEAYLSIRALLFRRLLEFP